MNEIEVNKTEEATKLYLGFAPHYGIFD